MTLAFTEFVSALIQENIIESPDDEIIRNLNKDGFPTSEHIEQARTIIHSVIANSRKNRLQSKKQEFIDWKDSRIKSVQNNIQNVDDMVSQIVSAMTSRPDNIPERLLIAFRNQDQNNTTDEDIQSLWNDLVSLGLIDPKAPEE